MSKGLRLAKTQGGSGYTGKVQKFVALASDANVMAIGDAVIADGSGELATGLTGITRANGGASTAITGVIVGFEPDYDALETKGRAASTKRYVYVQVDPNALYEIEIGSGVDQDSLGLNFLLTTTAPSTSGNLVVSQMVMGAADADGPLRLIELLPVDDTAGASRGDAGQKALVSIIRSQQTNLTGV